MIILKRTFSADTGEAFVGDCTLTVVCGSIGRCMKGFPLTKPFCVAKDEAASASSKKQSADAVTSALFRLPIIIEDAEFLLALPEEQNCSHRGTD